MTLRGPDPALTDPRSSLDADAIDDAQTNGFPVVASQFARRDRAGLMLGASIAILLGAATLFAMTSSHDPAPPAQPAQLVETPAAAFAPPQVPVAAVPVAPPPAAMATAMPPLPAPVQALVNPQAAMAARFQAPALILDNGAAPAPAPAMSAAMPVAAPPASAQPPSATAAMRQAQAQANLSPEEIFAQRVGGDGGDVVQAGRMSNPSMTVAQGTLMTAVLETAINSDLPGYVRAVVSQDVKSFDRSRVLIPRGTHLIGEYKSGLNVGQTRAYILWTRLLRTDGVSVALASPATDFAGANGLGGKVNSHFMKRFGSAILLSVIGAAGEALGGGSATVVLAGPQSVINSTAQRDMNIPPTVTVALGQPIRIFTARDLDFSSVSGAP